MTLNVTSSPSIVALRKTRWITSSDDGQKARQEPRACQKAPFKLAAAGINCACWRSRSAGDGAAMQEIADWLKTLGMSEYAERFAENGINIAALPHLTDQDLKDIGVLLGHRRVMLAAISKLAGAPPATPEPTARADPKPQDTAERRQVTVMFADLVGSTALSARMDPEDLREVISSYQKCVAETVRRFGGFVAKYMGDGVLVYFGYPEAHEDDAERAVRAGLELIAAVAGLKTRASLQTRVGIATGLVVVGDLIGSGAAQEQAIVGETPNLAARLQGIAEPNSVVIAEGTRRLLGNLFELEDLGAKDLKGIGGPVRTWAALRPKFSGKPLRGAPRQRPDGAGRAGGRTRIAASALVEGKDRRRPSGSPFWRGRYRQVAAHCGAARKHRHRAAHALALFLLAAAHRQRVLSGHRPDGTRGRTGARRHGGSEARQARCRAGADRNPQTQCGAFCRDAIAAERRPLSRARSLPAAAPAENVGSAQRAIGTPDALNAGADDLRGRTLDRSDEFSSCSAGWWTGLQIFACC